MKQSSSPQHPKRCPRGHKHLSWSPGDKEVSCWDCNRVYPLSECFDWIENPQVEEKDAPGKS